MATKTVEARSGKSQQAPQTADKPLHLAAVLSYIPTMNDQDKRPQDGDEPPPFTGPTPLSAALRPADATTPDEETAPYRELPSPGDAPEPITANGDMNSVVASETPGDMTPTESPSGEQRPSVTIKTPPPEKKSSKLSAFSRIFKPWKWRKRRKTSEKFQKTAVDLERKISVRTSREELIKRGVLKELDEDGQPIAYSLGSTTIAEEGGPEAVKESDSSSCDYKQANGSTTNTPTLPPAHGLDKALPNSITGVGHDDGNLPQTPPPADHTISLSPDYTAHQRPLSSPVIHSDNINYADHVQRPESVTLEPKQIRVVLPVEGSMDRQIPVMHKLPSMGHDHGIHDKPVHLPAYMHHGPPPSLPLSHHESTPSPVLNNNVYNTPTSLMYPTPTLKQTSQSTGSYSPTTPTGPRYPMVEEIPMHEPDNTKRPLRSALKGSKSKELLQRQLQQKLEEKQRRLQMAESVSEAPQRSCLKGSNGTFPRAPPPKVAPKPRVSLVTIGQRVSDSHNKENREYYDNIPDYDNVHGSDSDEEVQYDERESILAAKVQRQDSLARFLSHRPDRRVLLERNIIPAISGTERQMERDRIGNRLSRRLSLRPSAEELEHRNILHKKSYEEYSREKEQTRQTLIRKLSFRPTVDELKERKIIKFNDYYEVTEANEYDRRADKPWTRLTPKDKAAIRKELNEFKSTEMDVHDESRHLTRFHRP